MVRARAPYMEWAKSRRRPRIDLAGSNLLACTLEDLPGARQALDLSGESPHGYAPLVSAIASRYGVPADHVATAGGCSGANFLACAALLDAGDHVLIERPTYDPLVAAVQMLGGVPIFFERRFEEGFALDAVSVEKALTPTTRLVIVSNPHNPSGVLAPVEEIAALGRVAERAGVRVLVDEVYLETIFDQHVPPAATISPSFISSNSLTKTYGLSALRSGWTLAAADVTEKIRRARDIVDVSGPIPAERLALLAFRNLERLAARAQGIIEPNRRLFAEFLAAQPALECAPVAATIAFPRFRDGRDSGGFVRSLFEKHGVAVVPGSFFGLPSHFRVSLGGASPSLREGLESLGRCLAGG
jgi:aspartate/methionine/tyrosine aminotransferase